MDSARNGLAVRGSKGSKPVVIRADVRAALAALPPVISKGRHIVWTQDMDDGLLEHWDRANKRDVARVLGVDYYTAKRRYELLTRREA
jgi:hypothetical protein